MPDGPEERERERDATRRGKKNWGDAAAASPAPLVRVWPGDATQVLEGSEPAKERVHKIESH